MASNWIDGVSGEMDRTLQELMRQQAAIARSISYRQREPEFEFYTLSQEKPLRRRASPGLRLKSEAELLAEREKTWAEAKVAERTRELEMARRQEKACRANVLRHEADIRRWPSDRAGRIRANAVAGFAAVGAVTWALVGLLPVALLCAVVALIATFCRPRQNGCVRGTREHLLVLQEEWDSDVDAHGEALTRLRLAEASVPVYEAFPELFPDGEVRFPE